MKRNMALLMLVAALACGACAAFALRGRPVGVASPVGLLTRVWAVLKSPQRTRDTVALRRPPLKLPLVEPRIVVTKSRRTLDLYSDGRIVRTYRIGLGFDPAGDKMKEGDGRTPEGSFYVYVKNPKSNYYLSLGLSYPTDTHAARGLRDGLITKEQHDQITRALQQKIGPPQNTSLGGLIYIHGHGSMSDWTLGCIALDDEEMKELYEAVPKGVEVSVKP